ncbi:MAG: hypothetical protein IJ499_00015, partial [Clostridia bacterium]|nr:hypothetical protein [Clostridia bacterium]
MNIPYQSKIYGTKRTSVNFRGLDRRLKAKENMLRDTLNMSSREENCAATRWRRGSLQLEADKIDSIVCTDILIDGKIVENAIIADCNDTLVAYFYENGLLVKRTILNTARLTTGKNNITASGGYLYFFPDKAYINLMNLDDYGSLEAEYTFYGGIHTRNEEVNFYETIVSVCDGTGEVAEGKSGYIRIECKKYKEKNGAKGDIIGSLYIGSKFSLGDFVTLKGFGAADGNRKIKYIPNDYSYLVLEGYIVEGCVVTSGIPTVRREIPDVEYVVASGNRLWGCYYGVDENGKPINEIYASALGDPKNWNRYDGISTDSFSASLGVDGKFTGAAVYGDTPVFFKENSIIRVYGSKPSEYQIVSSNLRGIEKGSEKSAVTVNDTLYYKTHSGIVRYNGGVPQNIDESLGDRVYKNAVAGGCRGKYYVSMENEKGEYELYVYDCETGVWHKEDDLYVTCFCSSGSELFMLSDKLYTAYGSGE